ncbi:MAG: hypothetical protein ACYDAQ_19940, partial [Mycobacteriales bacterium]
PAVPGPSAGAASAGTSSAWVAGELQARVSQLDAQAARLAATVVADRKQLATLGTRLAVLQAAAGGRSAQLTALERAYLAALAGRQGSAAPPAHATTGASAHAGSDDGGGDG